jgi:hypothetical protein
MKHINTWKLFNESRVDDKYILPKNAQYELDKYYINSETDNVEVYKDPKVDGTYAVRVYSKNSTFDLLWHRNSFDEVNFTNWPPVSDELRFIF